MAVGDKHIADSTGRPLCGATGPLRGFNVTSPPCRACKPQRSNWTAGVGGAQINYAPYYVRSQRAGRGGRLHIGCGRRRLPGWINADTAPGVGDVVLDLHDVNALPPNTYREIYGSHVLEHCWPQDTPDILRRLHASLLPGGTLRLSVPDLRLVVKNCLDSRTYGDETAALSVIYGGHFSRHDPAPDLHRQAFWHERLWCMLTNAGFINVREWGRGQYPAIDALGDYATQPCDANGKSTISLNMEADRPGSLDDALASLIVPGALIDVSIILGTVDRPQMLIDCVESIRASLKESKRTYEIIVAYGREDDASLQWMRAQHDVVPVLGGMQGAIEAFNRAYDVSRGRYVCQLNDDVLVDGDAIARATAHLDGDPTSAGVVFKFDRGDGKGHTHAVFDFAPALHPNQMVVRRETCEAVIERMGAFWGDAAHRTDKTYGGDSAFGVMCHYLGLRLDSVEGVTCRDLLASDELRIRNQSALDPQHLPKWQAMYQPFMTVGPRPTANEWPNLYVPRAGMPPRRSPIEAGRPLRLLHLSLKMTDEPQADMRRAFARIGPTVETSVALNQHHVINAAQAHKPDVVFAQIQGEWDPGLQRALRDAVGPDCTLVQWTGDVRTNNTQPVKKWLVTVGRHFDILLADGCAYPRKLKLDEHVPAACGYLSCGMDPTLNPWRPDEVEGSGAVFLGSFYPSLSYGANDRADTLEEVQRLVPGMLAVYGTGWKGTRIAADPFVPQAQASLIMRSRPLTVAMSLYNDMARYTSDRLKRAMGSGAVLAVRRFPDMEGLGLREGVNCLGWSTPSDLAALIRSWTKPEMKARRDAMRLAAATLAHERFTWDRVTEELLAIVRDYRARKGLA